MAPGDERSLTALVILGLFAAALYLLVRWIKDAPRTADPWGKDADDALEQGEAPPLCPHCLTPQEHSGWFCPNCGATVGPYCNYMPYIYVFAEGEVLRAGVTDRVRGGPLITLGFVLFSIMMFALQGPAFLLAPIYWILLWRNRRKNTGATT